MPEEDKKTLSISDPLQGEKNFQSIVYNSHGLNSVFPITSPQGIPYLFQDI